jgi:hypothetical protein
LIKAKIVDRTKVFDRLLKKLRKYPVFFEESLEELANKTTEVMRRNIKPRRAGSKGNLAKHITAEVIINTRNTISIGIGNIDKLSRVAPYWYVLSYGKTQSGKTFIPGGGEYRPVMFTNGGANAKFRGKGTGKALAFTNISQFGGIAPSPIRPIPYIQNTLAWLQINYRRFWQTKLRQLDKILQD